MTSIFTRVVIALSAGFLLLAAAFGLLVDAPTATSFFPGATQSVLAVVPGPVHICRNCGAPHGGVYHPNYCHNCIDKGETPVKRPIGF